MAFNLSGAMIPRKVRRMFDQRHEPRAAVAEGAALLEWRGQLAPVRIANLSASGAMIRFDGVPHIGEPVMLQLVDRRSVAGQVRWVRDGHVGINFMVPLE